MFVHSVYFTLKEGLSADERVALEAGLLSLVKAPMIADSFIGRQASTDREVIDKAYDIALVLRFADQAEHDAYQVHAIHDKFREDCAQYWSGVRIFDSVS